MSFETAGCGRKVPYSELRRVLSSFPAIRNLGQDSDFVDVARTLVMSIDTSRAIGADLAIFGELAVKHALGDIHARGAVGTSCAISVGLTGGAPEEFELIMEGVQRACAEEEMQVVKGHTSTGEPELVITCAIIGKVLVPSTSVWSNESAVFLTKPLGASRLLKLATSQHSEPLVKRSLDCLRLAHGKFLSSLQDVKFIASDVSGFGVVGNLYNLHKQFQLQFMLSKKFPRIDDIYKNINIMCEYERNKSDFAQFVDGVEQMDDLDLFGQEFCGPMIILVPMSNASMLSSISSGFGFELIELGIATPLENTGKPIRLCVNGC
jgi:thiamine monophosphate kinase